MSRSRTIRSALLRGIVVVVTILLAPSPGRAQPATVNSSSTSGGVTVSAGPHGAGTPAVLDDYVLGPGDVVSVSVWGYPDMTTEIAIRPDGKLTLPLIGSVPAAGVTVDALTRALTKAYAEYIIAPQITVLIKQYRKLTVSVLGQVQHPGVYELPAGARVLNAIAAAGGLTEAAATEGVPLMHAGGPALRLDLARALKGDESANVALSGGETIVVPEDLVHVINVQGQVVRPGQLRMKGPMRVLDALLQAGGLTERASLTQATLVHASGQSEPLALDGLLLHQDMSANVPLQPGDSIFIPEETNNKIYVLGDVRNPGVYPVQAPLSLLQALALAGGPEQRGIGTAKQVYVLRRPGVSENIEAGPASLQPLPNGGAMLSANLQELMKDPARGVTVQPGDVIVVPQTGLGGLQVVVNILAGLASVFYNFRPLP
jgi:polysaccharide export outer membrane protein